MFPIAKFVIIKPVRVELGALMVWDLFQPSILAIFSAFNGSSPVRYHLLHLHLSLYGHFPIRALCKGGFDRL